MKLISIITLFLVVGNAAIGQVKQISVASMKPDTLIWDYSNRDYNSYLQAWHHSQTSAQLSKITGFVIDGKKYPSAGFDILDTIPKDKIKRLLVLKKGAEVRKYFKDTTLKFAIIVYTK